MIFETRFIFPAPKYPAGDWQPRNLDFEEIDFAASDGTQLHGWYFPRENARFHLLYCHGNADFVPRLGPYADALRKRFQCSVFVFDYRGYGKSNGSPSESGILEDSQAARDWLGQRTKTAPDQLVVMGRSLGGAVAIDLAVQKGAAAVLVESTFTSIPDVAANLFPSWLPIHRALNTQLNSLAIIDRYSGPLLISHGDADELVPFEHGKRLFAAAPGPKEFFRIPGGTHNDPQPAHYFDLVEEFFRQRILIPVS